MHWAPMKRLPASKEEPVAILRSPALSLPFRIICLSSRPVAFSLEARSSNNFGGWNWTPTHVDIYFPDSWIRLKAVKKWYCFDGSCNACSTGNVAGDVGINEILRLRGSLRFGLEVFVVGEISKDPVRTGVDATGPLCFLERNRPTPFFWINDKNVPGKFPEYLGVGEKVSAYELVICRMGGREGTDMERPKSRRSCCSIIMESWK